MPRRIHFLAGSAALCGTTAVIAWSSEHSRVTCPQCHAMLIREVSEQAETAPVLVSPSHDRPKGGPLE